MQLPHRLVVITPTELLDEYDNPTTRLDYGPDAARRQIWGQLHPTGSREDPQTGRQPVTTTWRLFTFMPLQARDRVEWRGHVLEVRGEPQVWSPRFGHRHFEATLQHVQG